MKAKQSSARLVIKAATHKRLKSLAVKTGRKLKEVSEEVIHAGLQTEAGK